MHVNPQTTLEVSGECKESLDVCEVFKNLSRLEKKNFFNATLAHERNFKEYKKLLYYTYSTFVFCLSLFFKNLVNANEILSFVLITPWVVKQLQDKPLLKENIFCLSFKNYFCLFYNLHNRTVTQVSK